MTSNRRRKKKKLILSTALLMLIAVLSLFQQNDTENSYQPAAAIAEESLFPDSSMTVHYLDVGQGASTLVEAQGHYMLIDGGDRSYSSFVVSYLKKAGVTKLDYILATHYHADHLNGVVGTMNAFLCDMVICPDYEGDTSVYESFFRTANEKKIPLVHPSIHDRFSLGNAVFTVIAPVAYTYDNDNNNSIGIRLVNGQDVFLFTGDAEAQSEEDFCKVTDNLSCDVYAAGHHGSAGSTTWSLLEKALPSYVVISCGAGNSYGHPHEETMQKLEAVGAKVFRTDLQGTVLAFSSGSGISFSIEPAADYSED